MDSHKAPYSNKFGIRHRGKSIPYGGSGTIREDRDANHGFKYVKGDEAELRKIPELAGDPALCSLALFINAKATGLFTVGCVSGPVDDEHGFRDTGYMEFAINSKAGVADAPTSPRF